MSDRGVEPVEPFAPVADGRIHRFRVAGDSAGTKNGWAVCFADPFTAVFGSWKQGRTHTWQPWRPVAQSAADRARMRAMLRAAQQERQRDRALEHAQAAVRARARWDYCETVRADHPYLQRKKIRPHGARAWRDALVIPVLDEAGEIVSLQFIDARGGKRFLSGGRVQGCHYLIGGAPSDLLLVAEGYATACTLFEATGWPCAVAFNAGNLLPAARSLHARYPGVRFIFCADDDRMTPGNPGLLRATEAARAMSGQVVYPHFAEAHHG
ncbi:MAG: hypothetical protein BGO13_00220 [Burkholderiales bacterium 66-5]|nr:MAG: hypothetical protein BGO13_00220 [Burkholderiales bacterium 66-5]